MSHYEREREDGDYSLSSIEVEVDKGNKYHKYIKGVQLDVYDVLLAFNITNPGLQHALKKLLCTGLRGHKSFNEDAKEAIVSINRAIELETKL